MRILIITNHFWPEEFRINDLALALKNKGHQITVITGVPNYPLGNYFPGYGIFARRTEDFQGITVKRFPVIPSRKGRRLDLILNYLSITFFSCLFAPWYGRGGYDLIFVFETSPIMIGLSAIILKKIKSVPLFFWVLDLWPESLSATGAIHSPLILKPVENLVRFIYKQCDRVLISSPGFSSSVTSRGVSKDRVAYFPNWVEPSYRETSAATDSKELPQLPQGFRIMFAGNVGVAQDFETILAAAEILKVYPEIQWIILGDGRMFEWLKEQVNIRGLLENVHLRGRYPMEAMPYFFSLADVMLVTLRRDPIFDLTVPGKIQSYLTCGKPIIAALDGEGRRLVEESGAGITCPAGNPDALAKAAIKFYKMSEEQRNAMGLAGKIYCDNNFDRNMLLDRLEGMMKEMIEERV